MTELVFDVLIGCADQLLNELYLLGQKAFDVYAVEFGHHNLLLTLSTSVLVVLVKCSVALFRFTPAGLNTHSVYFTVVFTFVVSILFFYMAAEFPRYHEKEVSITQPSEIPLENTSEFANVDDTQIGALCWFYMRHNIDIYCVVMCDIL